MKAKYLLILVTSLIVLPVFYSAPLFANWLSNSKEVVNNRSEIVSADNEINKKDSMPEGVTQDWLNSLTDENGKKIAGEDPEGDAFQSKILNGLGSGYKHGTSVSSAGDVNGDGFDDIIVGAPGYTTNTGRAYIYFGGSNMNIVADVVMTGASTNNYFGYSVSSAGDVNGDGYSDVIVGSYGYSSNAGRAYIYYGGIAMNNGSDVIMTGSAGTFFGTSVSSAGDVNGDGYSDVIVGANIYSANTGRAYIYLGGSSMNNVSDLTLTGEATGNYFGSSVSSAGDVNGDGYSDVIVGAYGYSSNTGRAYIFHGGVLLDNTSDLIMTGETTNNYFGCSVSTAGDVNGDGYSDVVIGAYGYLFNNGSIYIYLGAPAMSNVYFHLIGGESTNNYFGYSVSSAGDVNGDGYSDVIAGAYGNNTNTGKTYIYFGGLTMKYDADAVMTGSASLDYYGRSVSSAGDFNGDGYSDIIVGADGFSGNTGRAYLYDYYLKNEIIPDYVLYAETEYNTFGTSVSSAGDVNGDGYSDVIVGADNYNSGTGRAYIYLGGASMDNIADVTMTGTAGYHFGESVSSAGDVNGDGYSDVIVGAPDYSSSRGRAYIYFGGAVMNNVSDVILTGEATGDEFGLPVSTAGDLNGDGYSDVIVGARLNDATGTSSGSVYIYFGGFSMNNTTDITLIGEFTADFFGSSVSTAGDVNNDGFSDIIVGSYGSDGGGSSSGKVYIYFGGSTPDSNPDVTINGTAAFDYLGYSVSGAGDVNGDGFSDVIAGAYGSDAGNSDAGRAYIYYGGIAMNNSPNVTFTGESDVDYFGYSVSGAGDINNDGFADVIIGSYNNDNAGLSTGKSYVYFGGISMNSTVDVIMKGDSIGDTFGRSVSSAGDINGDGYGDIIVGAEGNDVAGTTAGSAYIFTGSAISAKPVFNYVKDVPNDQGGKVNLKWARSGFDVNGINKITDYYVEMSNPPSGGNFAWLPAATVPAVKNSFYSINIDTPYDSSSNSTGTFYFRITARTSNSSEYWRSGILSGRSIDNIAPLMVSPFTAASSGPDVRLNWQRSSAPDLLNYVLFRNVNPTIDPYTETPWMTATDSTLLDTAPLIGSYYYFIVAQDIHGNYSSAAVTQNSSATTVELTMFIEGFYNAGSNTMVSDTVTVQLRNSASPFAIADESKGIVASNGTAQISFGNAGTGNYYIVLLHRNSVETWSASPASITSGGNISYNFSTTASQAFGNNMKQADSSPLRFAIYSGDENQDGFVNLTVVVNVYNNATTFINGYVASDMNGDNLTDLSDIVITSNNAGAFVGKVTP